MPHARARSTWVRSLAAHLLGVGVLPEVVDRRGEAAVAGEQRRRVGERSPAIAGVLGVEREVDADVVAFEVLLGGMAGPRAGTISDVHVAAPSRIAW